MNDVIFREASEADLPATLAIYNDVVLNTAAIYEESPRTLEQHVNWFYKDRSREFPYYVVCKGDRVVGYCGYGPFRARHCYHPTVELYLHLSVDQRGRGLGSYVLDFLVDDARKRGLHAMIAGIDSENAASIHLHAKLGFRKAGELVQVAKKFDAWRDLTLMQLVL